MQARLEVTLLTYRPLCFLTRQWGLVWNFGFPFFFFSRAVTNRRLVTKAHASPVHAYSTWNLQKLSSWKVSPDSMISNWGDENHIQTVRGRPALKDVKRFRNGSVCKPHERSIYERTFCVNLSRIMLDQRTFQPKLSTLHIKSIFRSVIVFFLDMIVNQVESQHEIRNVWILNKSRQVGEFV